MTPKQEAALKKAQAAAKRKVAMAKEPNKAISVAPQVSIETVNAKLDCVIKALQELTEQMGFIVSNMPVKLNVDFLRK